MTTKLPTQIKTTRCLPPPCFSMAPLRRITCFQPLRRLIALLLVLITVIVILEYYQLTLYVESDALHPLTTHWQSMNLQQIIRPEIDTTIIRPYIDADTCKYAKDHPNGHLHIIIMVSSAPANKDARKAIRETWANKSVLPSDVTVLFILGRTMDEYVTKSIYEEARMHKDMVVEDFIDSYENLTLKTLFSLKWVSINCEAATHLLKTDDDMLILVDNLWKMLTEINLKINLEKPPSKTDSNMMDLRPVNYVKTHFKYSTTHENFGPYLNDTKEMSTSGAYILGYRYLKIKPIRDKESKWFLPYTLYPAEYLPDFISGTAYVIAVGNRLQGSTKSILMNSLLAKSALPLEDVFITGVIASRAMGIPLLGRNKQFHKNIPLILPWSVSKLATCFCYHSVAIHGLEASDIINGWKFINRINEEECNSWKAYIHKSLYSIFSI